MAAAEAKSTCVCIYWLMNQYDFSSTESPGCNVEQVSIASTWSPRKVGADSPAAGRQAGGGRRLTEGGDSRAIRSITHIPALTLNRWP